MNAPDCPKENELVEYATGMLNGDRAPTIELHLAGCKTCADRVDGLPDDNTDFLRLLRESVCLVPPAVLDEPEYREALESVCGRTPECGPTVADLRESTNTAVGDSLADAKYPGHAAAGQPSSRTGQQLGQYELLEELGKGGMGVVYKARHRKLDRIVALKVLPESLTNDAKTLERFEIEMRAIGSLDHPNIVRAQDADEVDGTHLLVMEYVDGENLSALIKRRGSLPVDEACSLIRQAALGLQHIHQAGMVHRDIKPGNLMLSKDGTVRILDLGLALLSKAHASQPGGGITATGQVMGTLDYMAPEQADDTHAVDIRADIYSLGATFYALLTGKAPYAGRGDGSVLQKLKILALEEPTPINEIRHDIPSAVAAVVEWMMTREPSQRFGTPQAVTDAINKLPKTQAVPHAPVSRDEKSFRTWFWGMMAIALTAVVVLVGLSLSQPVMIPPATGHSIEVSDGDETHLSGHSGQAGRAVVSSQREAAGMVIAQGGKVAVTSGSGPDLDWISNIVSASELPPDPLHVLQVGFPDGAEISGEDWRSVVSSLPDLKNCILAFHQRLLPEHIAALEGTSPLEILILGTIEPSTVNDEMLARVLRTNENIRKLAFHGIGLNGSCLDALPAPENLIHLSIGSPRTDFSENQIAKLDVSWMESLKRFPYLEVLALPRVKLSENHLLALKALTALKTLMVHGSPNMEQHLAAFSDLRQVKELNIDNGAIRNSHLPSLYECSHLDVLDLGTADVSPAAVETLQEHLPHTQIRTAARIYEPLHPRAEPQGKNAEAIHALKFDGVDDFVQLPIRYDDSHPITIEAWATPLLPQADDYSRTILGNKEYGGLSIDFSTKAWFAFYNDGTQEENEPNGLGYHVLRQPNGWPDVKQHQHTHIAQVFDGTTIRLFTNGVQQQAELVAGPHRNSKVPFVIGADPKGDASPAVNHFFRGLISEVRISRVARYMADFLPIETLSADDDTIASYHFDGDDPLVLKDTSGNEHHGNIHGAKWTTIQYSAETANH